MSDYNKLYYKTCREQASLTQEQAAALLGISEAGTLSKYENGHIPVSQELVAAMIKVYRTPSLAKWHVEYTNPSLVSYLRTADKPLTDGDAMLQLEVAIDTITEERTAIKAILRNCDVSSDEIMQMDSSVHSLRNITNKLSATTDYFEERGKVRREGGISG